MSTTGSGRWAVLTAQHGESPRLGAAPTPSARQNSRDDVAHATRAERKSSLSARPVRNRRCRQIGAAEFINKVDGSYRGPEPANFRGPPNSALPSEPRDIPPGCPSSAGPQRLAANQREKGRPWKAAVSLATAPVGRWAS